MQHRPVLRVLFAICFSIVSCQSNQERKNDATPVTNSQGDELSQTEKKLVQDSLNLELRSGLAAKYYSIGDLEKAEYHFMKMYEQDHKNLIALSSLGNIYYDSKQDDNAIRFYELALEIDPQNIDMRCDLATCYMNINKLKKAIQILRENNKIDSRHAKSHHNLSVILKKSGDAKRAEEEMRIYQSLTTESNKTD